MALANNYGILQVAKRSVWIVTRWGNNYSNPHLGSGFIWSETLISSVSHVIGEYMCLNNENR